MLRILTWNILNGGADPGRGNARWDTQIALVRNLDPDIWLVQEARGFDADGSARLFEAEASLDRRGFLSVAPLTGQHTAILVKPELRAVRVEHDANHFHHALARVDIGLRGLDRPLRLASIHLSPLHPALRAGEVGWLAGLAEPAGLAIVAGDANSLAPGDPEPTDWHELPAHQRVRYLAPGSEPPCSDRRALGFLHAAGFVDAAFDPAVGMVDTTPTVPTKGYPDAEFVAFRSDHILLSPALADARRSYRVVTEDRAQRTSDHLPVMAELDLERLR